MSTGVSTVDEDIILQKLEMDDDNFEANFREMRASQLMSEMTRLKAMKQDSFGLLTEPSTEKQVIDTTTKSKFCVLHFYHNDFRRCNIINRHLEVLAGKFFNCKFIKVDVLKVPFLVERLKIKVLPCIVSFINGISVDRIVGFEELGDRYVLFLILETTFLSTFLRED